MRECLASDDAKASTLVALGVAIGLLIALCLVLVSSATQLAEQVILNSPIR